MGCQAKVGQSCNRGRMKVWQGGGDRPGGEGQGTHPLEPPPQGSIFENVREQSRTFENTRERSRTFENIREHSRTLQRTSVVGLGHQGFESRPKNHYSKMALRRFEPPPFRLQTRRLTIRPPQHKIQPRRCNWMVIYGKAQHSVAVSMAMHLRGGVEDSSAFAMHVGFGCTSADVPHMHVHLLPVCSSLSLPRSLSLTHTRAHTHTLDITHRQCY